MFAFARSLPLHFLDPSSIPPFVLIAEHHRYSFCRAWGESNVSSAPSLIDGRTDGVTEGVSERGSEGGAAWSIVDGRTDM